MASEEVTRHWSKPLASRRSAAHTASFLARRPAAIARTLTRTPNAGYSPRQRDAAFCLDCGEMIEPQTAANTSPLAVG